MSSWPKQDFNSMVRYYGPVGQNQTSLVLPYEMRLTWDLRKKVPRITCHEKVAPSLERIFRKVLDEYGPKQIVDLGLDRFSGALNVRKMRGSKSAWSIHSWGAALDFDDVRNQLRWGRDRAALARAEYIPFWRIFESEGWVSLGRVKNFDWMHVQAARL